MLHLSINGFLCDCCWLASKTWESLKLKAKIKQIELSWKSQPMHTWVAKMTTYTAFTFCCKKLDFEMSAMISNFLQTKLRFEPLSTCLGTEDPSQCWSRHFKAVCVQHSDCPDIVHKRAYIYTGCISSIYISDHFFTYHSKGGLIYHVSSIMICWSPKLHFFHTHTA